MRGSLNRYAFGIRFVCACVLTCAVSAPVAAQPATGGPFSGLFGANARDATQSLDFRGSLFAAYDTNVLAEAPGGPGGSPLSQLPTQAGVANGLNGSLAYGYRRHGTRAQFQVSSTASLSEFGAGSNTGNLWIPAFAAGTGLGVNLTRKVTLGVNASVGYAPFYQYAPFFTNTQNTQTPEGSPVTTDYGYAVNSSWVTSGSASAGVTDKLSKKSSLSVGVVWSDAWSTAYQSAGAQPGGIPPVGTQGPPVGTQGPPVGTQGFSTATIGENVVFSHSLTRKLGVHVGYGLQESRLYTQGGSPWIVNHVIDVGVDYGDGLSIAFARHYMLAFSVGMGVLTQAASAGVAPVSNNQAQTSFRVNGSATLSRSIGRTWSASVGYVRGTSYIIGFLQPFNSDSVNAGVGGILAPRLHFSAATGYARGTLAFSGPGGDITSLTASTMLTYGLTRHVGLYSQAAYYQYDIPNGFTAIAFQSSLRRRVASAGLTFWLPLINQRAKP
jgi:hypothetical protein